MERVDKDHATPPCVSKKKIMLVLKLEKTLFITICYDGPFFLSLFLCCPDFIYEAGVLLVSVPDSSKTGTLFFYKDWKLVNKILTFLLYF